MRLEIGYGTTIYGTVEETAAGLLVAGNGADAQRRLENIVRNMRRFRQSDHDLMVELPRQLTSRLWAREVRQ